MAATDLCSLCRKRGTQGNPANKHHIKGKRYPDVMVVHSKTCHQFAQWVTNLYLEAGLEDELSDKLIVYLYNRVLGLRHSDGYVLHPMRG